MSGRNYSTVSIPKPILEVIDAFQGVSGLQYRSRAEVIHDAILYYLGGQAGLHPHLMCQECQEVVKSQPVAGGGVKTAGHAEGCKSGTRIWHGDEIRQAAPNFTTVRPEAWDEFRAALKDAFADRAHSMVWFDGA